MHDVAHALNFYQTVVGDGIYCAVEISPGQAPKQVFPTTLSGLMATVEQMAARHKDTYFTVAGLLKKGNRKAANAASMRSVFIDLDCGPTKPFADQKAAGVALQAAIRSGGLPSPSWVVNTGGGLHAYWCADTTLSPVAWKEVAVALVAKCKAIGLHIDASISADTVRIMRAPYTMNCKLLPKLRPTSLLSPRAGVQPVIYTWGALRQAFGVALRDDPKLTPLGVTSNVFGEATDDDFAAAALPSRSREGYLVETLRQHCRFIADAADTRGANLDEPQWHRALSLAAHCADGEAWAMGALSDGHEGFDPAKTKQKYARALEEAEKPSDNVGPPTCASISTLSPSCQTCPNLEDWKGKKGYPWKAANLPLMGATETATFALPPEWLPAGFRRKPSGDIVALVDKEVEGSDGTTQVVTTEEPFTYELPRKFQLVNVEKASPDQGAAVHIAPMLQFYSNAHGGASRRVDVTGLSTSGTASLERVFTNGGVVLRQGGHEHMRKLMLSIYDAIETNRRKAAAEGAPVDEAPKAGFSLDGLSFTIGGLTYRKGGKGGVVAGIPTERIGEGRDSPFARGGTLEGSVAVVSAIMNGHHPIMSLHIAMALASPLLFMAANGGMMCHTYSTTTGSGKSTFLVAAATMWGSFTNLAISASSSLLAWQHVLSVRSPFPAFIDEVRFRAPRNANAQPGAFTPDDIKCITDGRTGTKMTQQGTMRPEKLWCCFTLTASNASLDTVLAENDLSAAAVTARTMNIDVGKYAPPKPLNYATNYRPRLDTHYGHIGPAFIQILLDNYPQDKLRRQAERLAAYLLERVGLQGAASARFRAPNLALALLSAGIAAKHGLLPFKMQELTDTVIAEMQVFSEDEQDEKEHNAAAPDNIYSHLLDYARLRPRMNIVSCKGSLTVGPDNNTGEAVAHFDLDKGVVILRPEALLTYMRRDTSPLQGVRLTKLRKIGAQFGQVMDYRLATFGRGTEWATSLKRCVVLALPAGMLDSLRKSASNRSSV